MPIVRRFLAGVTVGGVTYRLDGMLFRQRLETGYTPWQLDVPVSLPKIEPAPPDNATRVALLQAFLERANAGPVTQPPLAPKQGP